MTETTGRLRFMIVGVARSGTTLIQRLASELEDVWVPPETHFWRHAVSLAKRVDWPLTAEAVDALLESFAALPGLADFELDHDAVRGRLPETAWLWDVFEAVTVAASPSSAHIIGEKTPAHHRWAHRLLTEVGSLRVIGVRRDPYETFLSHLDLPWGVKDPVEFAVRWRTADEEFQLLQSSFPDRVLVLDHHAVASDPDDARTRIAHLLGVESHTRASAVENVGPLFDPTETWKADATAAIEPSARRRDDLSPSDAEVIRSVIEADVPPELSAGVAAAVTAERRLAAAATQPLPITGDGGSAWQASDPVRARVWESRAIALRNDVDRARDRVADWQARAEDWQTRAVDWQARAEDRRDAAERWEARAEELNDAQKRTTADLATARAETDSLRRELNTLQGRRSVRAANGLGRVVRRLRRH